MRIALLLLAALSLAACATVQRQGGSLLAITVDDLPVHGPLRSGETAQQVSDELLTGFREGGALSATGFVNGHWTKDQPSTLKILQDWRASGLLLANHGWTHRDLDSSSLEEGEEEIVGNEALLQELGARTDWKWFRYPFLREGGQNRQAIRKLLAERGYRIAAVTMDFSDWQWTAPYARCREKGDEQAILRLEDLYLRAAGESIAYSRDLSRAVHGREIPYVLLIHAGAFTARMTPRLLDLYRGSGFRFVSLAQAEKDPAYAAELSADGQSPPATLEGWAAVRGVPLPSRPSYGAILETICR